MLDKSHNFGDTEKGLFIIDDFNHFVSFGLEGSHPLLVETLYTDHRMFI
jgi:hypothetical protein